MKVIVIGLGSMGKRRIRLLKKLAPEAEIIGVDSNEERCAQVREEYQIFTSQNLEQVLVEKQPERAFICTSPLSHNTLIHYCLEQGMHVFTEINLTADGYKENVALAKEKGVTLFLSSTFLYREEMEYIRKRVNEREEPVNYTYHTGQYLPDWHPWESYKDMFLGDKRTNGCRELMAIEFPWLVEAFGNIIDVKVIKSRNTKLQIDYADNYLMLLEHEDGNKGMVALDVVSRKAVRKLEVFGEHMYMTWEGTPDSLFDYDIAERVPKQIELYQNVMHQEGYTATIIENAYAKEIECFFNCISGKEKQRYGFEQDREILKWIDIIEERI